VRLVALAAAAMAGLALAGCAVTRQMLSDPDDFGDYRAYRQARHPGTRLARAQAYLEHHPGGEWATEVRTDFEAEEGAWIEAARASRERALDYIVDLPTGPNIDTARKLLLQFDENRDDKATLELLAAARRTEAMLDIESERRRRIGELVLAEIGALLDPATWGASVEDPPPALAQVLRGAAQRTWGAATDDREDDVYFVVPTREGAQSRVMRIRFQLTISKGRVTEGRIHGEDLFVRWAEAMSIRAFDPAARAEREAAAAAVSDVVAGALEAQMPASSCAAPPQGREILVRGCNGWGASAIMGAREGDDDVLAVRGPRPRTVRGGR
jgi:hypothetical protein